MFINTQLHIIKLIVNELSNRRQHTVCRNILSKLIENSRYMEHTGMLTQVNYPHAIPLPIPPCHQVFPCMLVWVCAYFNDKISDERK